MKIGFILAILWLPAAVLGQTARLTLERNELRVGEPVRVTLTLAHPRTAEAWFPAAFAHPDITTVSRSGPRETSRSGVFREDVVTYEIALFALDSLTIPPIPTGSITGRDTVWAFTSPITLRMISVLPDSGATELRPPLPPESFSYPLWVWLLLFGGVLLAAAALLFAALRYRRRKETAGTHPALPVESAEDLLAALTRLDVRDREAVQRAYDALSTAVRVRLVPHLGTDSLTSRELLARAQRVASLKPIRAPLADVLRTLDLVRFAGVLPTQDRHNATLKSAAAVFASLQHDPAPEPDRSSA